MASEDSTIAVAVIAVACELLLLLLGQCRAAVVRELLQEPYLETLVLMMAKGPPSLHERVVDMMLAMSADKRVPFALRPHASALAEAYARALCSGNPRVRLQGSKGGAALAAGDARLRQLMATEKLAEGILEMIQVESDNAPEVRKVEFRSGKEMVYRDFSRLRDEPTTALISVLELLKCAAEKPSFVGLLDAKDA